MTGIATVFFPELNIGWRDWLKALMPISFDQYWFVSRYVALFFMIPFLNHLLNTLDRKSQDRLILTGFLLLSVFPMLSGQDMFVLLAGYSTLWFMYLYLFAGWISINELWKKVSIKKCLVCFIGANLCSIAGCIAYGRIARMLGMVNVGWGAYSSPFILVESVSLLIIFAKVRVPLEGVQTIIGYIAPSVFSVYVLHSNKVFRNMIGWNGKFAFLTSFGTLGMIGGVLCFAIDIFTVCVLIDIARRVIWGRIQCMQSMKNG